MIFDEFGQKLILLILSKTLNVVINWKNRKSIVKILFGNCYLESIEEQLI